MNNKKKTNAIDQIWNQAQFDDEKSHEDNKLDQKTQTNNLSEEDINIKENKTDKKRTLTKKDIDVNAVNEEEVEKIKQIVARKKRTTRIIFRIHDSLNKRIDDFCEKYNFIKGKVCRIAVLEYIRNFDNLQSKESFTSNADNLISYKDDLEKKSNTFQFLIGNESLKKIDDFCENNNINRSMLCIKSILAFMDNYESLLEKQNSNNFNK